MKLTHALIDDYLAGSLGKTQAAQLELWLKKHPADAVKVARQRALSAALAASAPNLSAARSRQLWSNIKARVEAEQAPAPVIVLGGEPWYAFFFRPWARAGWVTAAVAVALVLWRPWAVTPQAPLPTPGDKAAPAAPIAAAVAATARVAVPRTAVLAKAAPASAGRSTSAPATEAMVAAAVPDVAKAAQSSEPTEVERALADSGVDGMIDSYLEAQRRQAANTALLNQGSNASFGQGASSPLAGFTQSMSIDTSELDSAAVSAAKGGQDNNGFWNWTPAALALNRRDWTQARVELDAARSKAAEPSERAFASSALTLLSAPGAPLAGQGEALPTLGELRVLGAGRWQLLVDNRLARFSEGVSTRLPGFRAVGDSLLLDLTFDRGTFAPGTRFTRMAGEAPAEVLDAQGQALSVDEFSAPAGATYNVRGRQLKLR